MKTAHYILHIDRLLLDGLDLTPQQAEQLRRELSIALRARLAESQIEPATPARLERITLPSLNPSETGHVGPLASGLSERIADMLSSNKREVKRV